MGELISLSQARKAREKRSRERQAAANRVRFGRDKAERLRDAEKESRLKKELDGKALKPDAAESESDPKR